MAGILHSGESDAVLKPLEWDDSTQAAIHDRAARTIARHATDADDLRELLGMLGIQPRKRTA